MGLDDFKSKNRNNSSNNDENKESDDNENISESDIDIDLNGSSNDDSVDNTSELDENDIECYGDDGFTSLKRPMQRRGGLSDRSRQEVIRSIDTKIEIDDDNVKYHLPIFTIVTSETQYESGQRYQLSHTKEEPPKAFWHNRPVSCIGTVATELSNMNRELPMFEAGSTNKETVMEHMNGELDEPVNGGTTVFINFLADMFLLRDLAQSNEDHRAGELVSIQKTIKRALHPHLLNSIVNKDD